jgi:hypothetical protein
VVDDFGVKYVSKEHVDHFIWCIKQKYELTEDWTGNLYCGIKLNWDYNAHTLAISTPGYIKMLLLKCKHQMPSKQQNCPYAPSPKQYGTNAQAPLPVDISPNLSLRKSRRYNMSSAAYNIMPRLLTSLAISLFAQPRGSTTRKERAAFR